VAPLPEGLSCPLPDFCFGGHAGIDQSLGDVVTVCGQIQQGPELLFGSGYLEKLLADRVIESEFDGIVDELVKLFVHSEYSLLLILVIYCFI
jgi:hypothetical protein